ncbi:MAG TPA: hypothetical protein DCE41_36095 [Cytophagales bacterium]|nr:hypothetical protein [Cytophagales bacterium]HAA18760.1 hypothetical protein [Cytophagales bacterium]HAP63156.1 hypothetical protein [Cytophagales bacterium]
MKASLPLFLSILLLGSCKLADLQTDASQRNAQPEQAREWLERMAEAHGIDVLQSLDTYTVSMEDEFFGMMGGAISPYGDKLGKFTADYIPGTFDGRMTMSSGKLEGQTWGIQSWQTYTQQAGQDKVWKQEDDAYFWLPTYQYFVEFPFRILQADMLALAGEQTIMGKPCVGVLASWGQLAPQEETDQYLAWIDKETYQLVKLQYTVREAAGFMIGSALYRDYQDYGGLKLPSRMSVGSKAEEGKYMHEMRILDFTPNALPVSELRPQPGLAIMGDAKPE